MAPSPFANELAEKLIEHLRPIHTAVVALSGGVDSAVVAAAAFRALGDKAIAVTGIGAAVSSTERSDAKAISEQIGIQHFEVETREIHNSNYVKNDSQRCYHCKSTLYAALSQFASSKGVGNIVSGTNFDDLGDFRPGIQAGKEFKVLTPLADLRITKPEVRLIAEYFQLSISEKPASPCLASRIAYGQSVTPERLVRIESAEAFLKQLGFVDVRVRIHADELARIELHPSEIHKILEPEVMETVQHKLHSLGFHFVTLDLAGRQSGSLNRVLPVLN